MGIKYFKPFYNKEFYTRMKLQIKYYFKIPVFLYKETSVSRSLSYESPEGTRGFSKKAISKSLYRIVQSVLTD